MARGAVSFARGEKSPKSPQVLARRVLSVFGCCSRRFQLSNAHFIPFQLVRSAEIWIRNGFYSHPRESKSGVSSSRFQFLLESFHFFTRLSGHMHQNRQMAGQAQQSETGKWPQVDHLSHDRGPYKRPGSDPVTQI